MKVVLLLHAGRHSTQELCKELGTVLVVGVGYYTKDRETRASIQYSRADLLLSDQNSILGIQLDQFTAFGLQNFHPMDGAVQ